MNHNLIENSPSCINTAWLRRALPLGHRELSSSPARVHRCLDFKDLLVWPIWVFWVTSDNKVSNWRLGKGSGSISSSELKQRNTVSSLLRFGSQREGVIQVVLSLEQQQHYFWSWSLRFYFEILHIIPNRRANSLMLLWT
ncbi:uncharacterized protein LOC126785415 isoform X2 [Argentina anserina]|uniref:uncharacterized protein LOC126785415 isoform X2 n=1 Tax=Argentina anserina TaxID=57926 RepID=UPI002176946E|nr:uncharacterized protein LOC126785415 isoform X2 [Potentilla anserina]